MKFEKISKEQYEKDTFNNDIHSYTSYDNIKLPQRATKYSAGYDIYSLRDIVLYPGGTVRIPTGIKVQLDDDKFLAIVPRSSLGFKFRLQLDNTIGIIDSDYYNNASNEGHIWVKITNDSKVNDDNHSLIIREGDAICQAIILPYYTVDNDESNKIREGGLGSTNNS